MKSHYFTIWTLLMVTAFTCQGATAQITINTPGIPKFPKIKKEKQEPAKQLPGSNANGRESQTAETDGNKNVVSARAEEDHPGLLYELKKIDETRVAIDKYGPDWPYWPEGALSNEYIASAISKSYRETYLKRLERELQAEKYRLRLHAALDVLNTSVAKKLPTRKPGPEYLGVRSPAGEKMILQKLKERLGNTVTLTFYKSGFQSNWLIYKDSIGLPQYRFMRGYIYAKNPADDHPYCHLYYVSISQQYAGGGTYGSSYATFEDDLVVGCP